MAIILKKEKDESNAFDISSVEIKIDSNGLGLSDLLEEIKGFISACGYYVNPHDSLEFISEEEEMERESHE